MTNSIHKRRWDIFCRVIDNYGDIGVCWRLARQLSNEYSFDVHLWVDEIQALVTIWPSAKLIDHQLIDGVTVERWDDQSASYRPANVVIEAFACNLPESYVVAMKQLPTPPRWFNLEYLSAELWVEECHGLNSMHPQHGLKNTFYFPGFTSKTGGLLKEKKLFVERDEFQRNKQLQDAFMQRLGVAPQPDAILVSLFGYENSAISSLLDSFSANETPIVCLVPAGRILPDINLHFKKTLTIGDVFTEKSLTLKIIPFLIQTDYDRLLWLCDINFVRGEDSFVRAQWAAKPFIWHIYPQDDDVHMAKLEALLNIYLKDANSDFKEALGKLWHKWNRGENCSESWEQCLENYQSWLNHSQTWPIYLESLGDLAQNIVHDSQKVM